MNTEPLPLVETVTLSGRFVEWGDGQGVETGDIVCKKWYAYYVDVLPPASWDSDHIQIGEPHDHRGPVYCARYDTLVQHGGNWVAIGRHPHAKRYPLPTITTTTE